MPPPYHGSCLCKEIEFEVGAEHIIVSCCHCSNCKKYTGTVFTTNVVFPAGSIKITKGSSSSSSSLQSYHDTTQDSGNVLERVFCAKCASPLYTLNCEFGRAVSVFYSALDDFRITSTSTSTSTFTSTSTSESKEVDSWPESEPELEANRLLVPPPQVEYYSKDRLWWVRAIDGADQPRTKPGRD